MTTNPNPARVTAAMWWLWEQLHVLEPTSQLGGIYASKPGYHGTRAENDPDNYSVRDAVDKLGPDDKSGGIDWTMPEAQTGDYRRMARYGDRLEAAHTARDPRLAGWREALGQTDLDATAEGLDFRYWTRRTPDGSHAWHWHLSECRAYTESYDNKKALLSVLKGETLAQYLAAGGVLLQKDGEGDDMSFTEADLRAFPWQYTGRGIGENNGTTVVRSTLSYVDEMLRLVRVIAAKVDIDPAELEAIERAAQSGAERGIAEYADEFAAAVIALLPDTPLTRADVEAAVRGVFADAATTG